MFFRRHPPKVVSFAEKVDILKGSGFGTQSLPDGRVRISKHGIGAIIGDEGKGQAEIERAGVLVGGDIAVLLSAGYQLFIELPNGSRLPATSEQLHNLHQFEDDVKEALGVVNLYNTSLGTTSRKHLYDRVFKRDSGAQPKPWEKKQNRFAAPNTKGSLHL